MPADDPQLQQLLDQHASRSRTTAAQPPAAFLGAVRRRRHTRRLARAGAALAIVGVLAASTIVLVRPRLPADSHAPPIAAGPAGGADPASRWLDEARDRPSDARIGAGASSMVTVSRAVGEPPVDRRVLRPGVHPDSPDVQRWLGNS